METLEIKEGNKTIKYVMTNMTTGSYSETAYQYLKISYPSV